MSSCSACLKLRLLVRKPGKARPIWEIPSSSWGMPASACCSPASSFGMLSFAASCAVSLVRYGLARRYQGGDLLFKRRLRGLASESCTVRVLLCFEVCKLRFEVRKLGLLVRWPAAGSRGPPRSVPCLRKLQGPYQQAAAPAFGSWISIAVFPLSIWDFCIVDLFLRASASFFVYRCKHAAVQFVDFLLA